MNENRGLWRAKRVDNGEWFEGYLYGQKNGKWYLCDRFCETYEVDPKTLGECTGLKDKNGKLIFEGDIVAGKLGYCGNSDIPIAEKNFVVKYWKGCYEELYSTDYYEFEVIGNIHDNPELLTEKKAAPER